MRIQQLPEALLELHSLAAAGADVDKDEEGDDAGGDHGRIHGRQQDHCNGNKRVGLISNINGLPFNPYQPSCGNFNH